MSKITEEADWLRARGGGGWGAEVNLLLSIRCLQFPWKRRNPLLSETPNPNPPLMSRPTDIMTEVLIRNQSPRINDTHQLFMTNCSAFLSWVT